MLNNERAEHVAILAAALNDPRRSRIHDPRRGQYAVTFNTRDMNEAGMLERMLTAVGLSPQTNLKRDENGEPIYAFVVLYGHSDQRQLFELLKEKLDFERSEQLERLVLARGPIPLDIKGRIREASSLWGWSPETIATKMNDKGIVAGMGGMRWTAKKVKAALDDD
jgi:hypothetical protein